MTIESLQADIEQARGQAQKVFDTRNLLAGVMGGAVGMTTTELEFPEPDIIHAYLCMFGRRMGEPMVYKLAFRGERPSKWIGVSHPWGLKPADIVVRMARE